jgi:hypothetical protein
MMQPAKHRLCVDRPKIGRLDGPWYWAILLETEMSTRVAIVFEVLPQNSQQVPCY